MARRKQILAFDLGAESGRAVLGSFDGERLNLEVVHRFPNAPVRLGGTLHWNLLGQMAELKTGLRAALAKGGEVASLGCDTWGVDFGLLAADGSLLANPVHYRDSRTNGMMEEAFHRVPRPDIYRATGIQFMQLNTLFQLLSMSLRRSPALAAADTMLMMADLFHYFFCGEAVAESSLASTSQMCAPGVTGWAVDLVEKLGIPSRILPRIVPCGARLGKLRPDVVEETGGAGMEVIAPACHDTAAAVAAAPAQGEGWAYLSSGTWSLMGVEAKAPIVSDRALELNFTNEGGVGGTVRFLKNIMGLWLIQQCRRQWEKEGAALEYGEIARMAAAAKPFQAVVNPDDASFLNPPDMPAAIREFCARTGQKPPQDRGAVARCVFESLALRYRAPLEGLDDLMGRKHTTLHIVGGGSQNELLNQFAADACGVTVVAGPVEATAIGNVLMQAVALGDLGGVGDVRKVVRTSFGVKTHAPAPRGAWDDAYATFQQVAAI